MHTDFNIPLYASPLYLNQAHQLGYDSHQIETIEQFRRQGYLVVNNSLISDAQIDAIKNDTNKYIDTPRGRIQDAWKKSQSIKELAINSQVLNLLKILYGREPIPFQTLNFVYGTEQPLHSDIVHFNSSPTGFVCGVWVALEDVNLNNGPLMYAEGSHSLPEFHFDDINLKILKIDTNVKQFEKDSHIEYQKYEKFIAKTVEQLKLPLKKVLLKKGEWIIWSSNLIHGGSPILNKDLTRHSQVTHYYFQNCFHYSPRHSHPKLGRFFIPERTNILTNKPILPVYQNQVLELFPLEFPNLFTFNLQKNTSPNSLTNKLKKFLKK